MSKFDQINQSLVTSKTHYGTNGNDYHFGIWGTDYFYASYGADAFFGMRGNDTITYEYSNAAVSVDLSTGRGSGGTAQGDRYYSIENITGSRFDDQMKGNDDNNHFDGGRGDDTFTASNGNDTYNGGHGRHDRIEYFDLDNGIVVNFNNGGQGQVHQAGSTKLDLFTNIEEISGTHFDDVFVGDDSNNWFFGAAGDDTFYADAGRDEYFGGLGNDTIVLDGNGMTVNLATGRGYGGDAEGDKYIDINNVTITGDGNSVIGDEFANTIISNGRNVQIQAGAGSDTVILHNHIGSDIELGSGNDTLILDPQFSMWHHFLKFGNKRADGGSGSDTLDFSALDYGIIYDANAFGITSVSNQSNASFVTGDGFGFYEILYPKHEMKIESFENIIGTDFDDIFSANGAIDETFVGGEGADEFFFGLHLDNDDTVADFEVGTDLLHLFGLRLNNDPNDTSGNYDALFKGQIGSDIYIQDTADGAHIHIFGNDILLQGVKISELSESDFLFG